MVGRLSALKPFRLAELTHIARQVAADSRHPELFEDIVQEALLRYIQWPPRFRIGAWLFARQARDEVLRRELQQSALRKRLGESLSEEDRLEGWIRLWDARSFEHWQWLVRYAQSESQRSGALRAQACRYRAKLKELIERR